MMREHRPCGVEERTGRQTARSGEEDGHPMGIAFVPGGDSEDLLRNGLQTANKP